MGTERAQITATFDGGGPKAPTRAPLVCIATDPDTLVGRTLGSYHVLEKLGEGGMGVVYRGEHARIGRRVALKVLRPALVRQAEQVRRFFREARAVNRIGHPNVVDIVDFVEDYDSQPPQVFLVMELLEGRTVAEQLRDDGPMPLRTAIEVARQAAGAIAAVHAAGLLHRDLKPDNLFLVETDGRTSVKVLDFGIVKSFDGDLTATSPGLVVGTPKYMAPEQMRGQPLDARTDICALGQVIFAMVSGRAPYDGTSLPEVVAAKLHGAIPKLPLRTPAGESIPNALHALVTRCLQLDPGHRYPTATELIGALELCADACAAATREAVTINASSTIVAPIAGLDVTTDIVSSHHGGLRRRFVALAVAVAALAALAVVARAALRPTDAPRAEAASLAPRLDAPAASAPSVTTTGPPAPSTLAARPDSDPATPRTVETTPRKPPRRRAPRSRARRAVPPPAKQPAPSPRVEQPASRKGGKEGVAAPMPPPQPSAPVRPPKPPIKSLDTIVDPFASN